MSLTLIVESNPDIPLPNAGVYSEELIESLDELEEVAEENNLTSLSAFGRQIPDDYDGNPNDIEKILGPWEEWFAPEDGIMVVTALMTALTYGEDPVYDDDDCLLHVLRGLRSDFEIIKEQGAKFRLEVC